MNRESHHISHPATRAVHFVHCVARSEREQRKAGAQSQQVHYACRRICTIVQEADCQPRQRTSLELSRDSPPARSSSAANDISTLQIAFLPALVIMNFIHFNTYRLTRWGSDITQLGPKVPNEVWYGSTTVHTTPRRSEVPKTHRVKAARKGGGEKISHLLVGHLSVSRFAVQTARYAAANYFILQSTLRLKHSTKASRRNAAN